LARACGPRALQPAKMGDSGEQTGIMDRDKGSFGFIRQDGRGEDMFVMPAACVAFGGVLPPLKSRVKYLVVTDPKTGRPRAEDVKPVTNGVPLRAGTMNRGRGRFGFIRQDTDSEDMFVMPASCSAFGGCLPPAGTRVVYSVVPDEKTGLPRAEDVRPEVSTVASPLVHSAGSCFAARSLQNAPLPALPALAAPAQAVPLVVARNRRYGTFERDRGSYGFIQQDSGEDDMFCMPAAFGGIFPPAGTRVMYEVVIDPKTGRPRAEMMQTVAPARTAWRSRAPSPDVGARLGISEPQRIGPRTHSANVLYSGTMDRGRSNYGFIKQDSSDEDMFVLPLQCQAFGDCLPPLGTCVVYTVAPDPKTGRPSAQNVMPEALAAQENASTPDSTAARPAQRLAGTMDRDKGSFGFIKQDSSEEDMFVLPTSCAAFGGRFPPTGTRVVYGVVQDSKTGRPRAEEVEPEDDLLSVMLAVTGTNTEASTEDSPALLVKSDDNMDDMEHEQEDTTAEEALEVPDDLEAAVDGFLEATEAAEAAEEEDEEIYEAMENGSQETGLDRDSTEYVGTIDRLKGSYGFIRQDEGGPDMFVMPNSCVVFGGALPAIGTRVVYCVVTDPKTGRPRAEDVRPEAAAIPTESLPATALDLGERTGLMDRIKNGYGFIKQDSGEEDMFVMPGCCSAFGGAFPTPGTGVVYDVVTDPRTGRPRAGTVRPAPGVYGPTTTRTARTGAGPRIRPGPYT